MSAVLPALVAVPLLTALVVAVASRGPERFFDVVCNAATAVILALAVMLVGPVLSGGPLSWAVTRPRTESIEQTAPTGGRRHAERSPQPADS